MTSPRVLIVDDEPGIRQALSGALRDEGFQVTAVQTGEACLEAIAVAQYEVVLLDVWLPGIDGLETLTRIQGISVADRPVVVMISGHGTIETAVRATKLGAFDFLEKPLSIDRVLLVIRNASDNRRLRLANERLRESVASSANIVGDSVPMKALRQQLSLMAGTNGRVLIYGESGTGKELVAQALHSMSPRSGQLFVEVNCAAIPEDMIESELFGHMKGSFTAAHERKVGKFQKADGGTLFLDEVGDMSLRTQAKVLRSLEEQKIEPLGAQESIRVDVRVVAATNKNLEDEIARGNFREDLFYRLNVIPFHVPPLRERREDIPALANHFLAEFSEGPSKRSREFVPAAMQLLQDYHWPGNVRELRNLVERVVILHPGARIEARHIPLQLARKPGTDKAAPVYGSLQEVREATEREYILKKMEEANGNVTRAAELLGLERSNLYRKMKALGIGPRE